LIQSDDVETFAEKPEMEAKKITNRVLTYLQEDTYNFICLNFPNPDMLAHTADIEATKKSVSIVDKKVKQIVETVIDKGGTAVVTVDHGNAEEMLTSSGDPKTEHSSNPVPFIVIDENKKDLSLSQGKLADVAPTTLDLMGLDRPKEMTGNVLYNQT
ncbi:MAG: 2,3-bisphosphoglycerate-independent phosphoglycerate mutase, partial [Candidatus Paceibacteria bacterium]